MILIILHLFLLGGGDDYIFANTAQIFAGDGNDIIHSNMVVYGGYGDDVFYSTMPMSGQGWFVGEQGNDTAYGSNGYDQLRGDQGNDLIYGQGGDDSLLGGDGDDNVYGGDGNDYIHGDGYDYPFISEGVGNDILYGGDGNDTIETGNGGTDIAWGGNGNDHIIGWSSYSNVNLTGNKELHGEAGDDLISAGYGNHIITGGTGNDTITVFGGNSIISGNENNDTITVGTAGTEENVVYGGDGDDRVNYTGRYVNFGGSSFWAGQGLSYIYGGSGNDTYGTNFINQFQDIGTTYVFDESGSNDSYDLSAHLSTEVNFSFSGNNLIIKYLPNYVGSITVTDFLIPQHRIENFIFQNKSGSLFESLTNNDNNYTATLNTSFLGTDQNFVLALGGNDQVNAGLGNDYVWGGSGNDTLNGQDGDDTLYGETGNDILNGNAGIDALYGGDNNDTLRGGAGDDILDGGSGTDTASYSTATAAVVVNLATGVSSGADGSDTFLSIEDLVGSTFNDTLTGDGNNNTISGGSGNDIVYGGAGADILYGNSNTDFLYGEDGDDTLYGGLGNDTMNGGNGIDTVDYSGSTAGVTVNMSLTTAQNTLGEGTDTLSNIENLNGSNFNDTLTGTNGANIMRGNLGNDTINAGAGNDTLIGGDGNDILNGGDNDDTLYGGIGDDTINGGNGIDMVSYFTSATAVTVNLAAATNQGTGEGNDTITNVENIEGSVFADTLSGNGANNGLLGGAGADILYGDGGLDTLFGGSGSDTFLFKGETAFSNVDVVQDFANGAGGDFINISDVLLDFGYNALTDLLSDWVATTAAGANTLLQVDRDGAGTTFGMQSIAQIDNANLTLVDLTANGNLIA